MRFLFKRRKSRIERLKEELGNVEPMKWYMREGHLVNRYDYTCKLMEEVLLEIGVDKEHSFEDNYGIWCIFKGLSRNEAEALANVLDEHFRSFYVDEDDDGFFVEVHCNSTRYDD